MHEFEYVYGDRWFFGGVIRRRKRAKKELKKYAKALENAGFFAEAKRVSRITESLFGEKRKIHVFNKEVEK